MAVATEPAPVASGSSVAAPEAAGLAPPSSRSGPTIARGATASGDTEALETIQHLLAQAAQRCYPRAARRLGLVGQTTMRFCVDGRGAATQIQVLHSSGHDALDEAATECVIREAAPFPALGRCLSVPVRFELSDP